MWWSYVVAVMSDGRNTPQFINGGEAMWIPNSYHYPQPHPDPNYYYPPPPAPSTPEQQQQFWDHYTAMCSYMAEMNHNYGYPPFRPYLYTPPPPPLHYTSDSDECGYSSTDEMNYYAAYFKRFPPPVQSYRGYYPIDLTQSQTPQIVITPTINENNNNAIENDYHEYSFQTKSGNYENKKSSPSAIEDSVSTTTDDGSDTEVEDDKNRLPGLQTIKSVPDISIYKDNSNSDINSQCSETEEADEEEEDYEDQESLPHQLSVIFEESEYSEPESIRKVKSKGLDDEGTMSEGESSTATLDRGDDSDDDFDCNESSTVHVRLPLKLKFSKSENNEEVTTVIVGDSQIERSPSLVVQEGDLIIGEIKKDVEPEVSVTFRIPKNKQKSIEILDSIKSIENPKLESNSCDELNENDTLSKDEIKTTELSDVACDKKELLVVTNSNNINVNHDNIVERCSSESPIDFWKELGCDESKTGGPTADISVNITIPSKLMSKSVLRSPYHNLNSESDESKPEESDGYWEDDSSSTSILTVKIGKNSGTGSDNFSGSELESAGADEVENIKRFTKSVSDATNFGSSSNENKNIEDQHKDEENDRIPIEDLLYDESSSSSDEDDSSTSSSSSNSSEESYGKNKKGEEIPIASNNNKRVEEKLEDDVFFNENSKNGLENQLSVEQNRNRNRYKSQDESEEDDSGVTSDLSRHISETDTDPECGSELRKLTPYQRAATHSRLFKLLQDECSLTDDQSAVGETPDENSECLSSRKERLSLPLQAIIHSDPDSMSSSSGINSPASPTVSDKLVKELVQSLLNRKKSRHFRKLPMEKLYAAALRILQEDMDPYDTLSSDDSFRHSPIGETGSNQSNTATDSVSQNKDSYGYHYHDYCDYYNTWGNPYCYSGVDESLGFDILPSRAFKLLQERSQTPQGFSTGVIGGVMAKCPRVLSSKNVPNDLGEAPNSNSCPQASPSSGT